MMTPHALEAMNGDVVLAGTVWLPATGRPSRTGADAPPVRGRPTRDNDVLFRPIRERFLDVGVAVTSFDKRGVGESGGSWLDAGIEDQAADLRRSVDAARELVPDVPVGLFGHSQGGWVVLEAARAVEPSFVITNSGPAVSPKRQELFSTANRLRSARWSPARIRDGLTLMHSLLDRASEGAAFPDVESWMQAPERAALAADLVAAGVFVPDTDALWSFTTSIIDHDPHDALAALDVPLLRGLRPGRRGRARRPERRGVAVARASRPARAAHHPGGDHRLQLPPWRGIRAPVIRPCSGSSSPARLAALAR